MIEYNFFFDDLNQFFDVFFFYWNRLTRRGRGPLTDADWMGRRRRRRRWRRFLFFSFFVCFWFDARAFRVLLRGPRGMSSTISSYDDIVKQRRSSFLSFSSFFLSFFTGCGLLLSFTRFYRVLPGFTGFYWVFKVLSSKNPIAGEFLPLWRVSFSLSEL